MDGFLPVPQPLKDVLALTGAAALVAGAVTVGAQLIAPSTAAEPPPARRSHRGVSEIPAEARRHPAPSVRPGEASPLVAEREARGAGKKVRIYVDGCFDMMHYGHSNALRQARALGDELVVGLVSDDEIVRNKGSEPVMPFEERLATLAACKFVDEVIAGVAYELTEDWVQVLLKDHQIDYIAHGDDPCVTADGTDAYAYPKSIGRFRMFRRTEGVSTTDLVGRMLLRTREHHIRPGDGRSVRGLRSSSLHDGTAAAAAAAADAAASDPSGGSTTGQQQRQEEAAASAGDASSSSASVSSSSSSSSPPASASSSSQLTATPSPDWQFLPTSRRIALFAEGRTPAATDTVVYIAGSWDLFNAGHTAALQEARQHGDFVLVGVYDDDTVHALHGRVGGAPVMNLFERALSVLACRFVDDVVLGAPLAVNGDLIKTFKVNVVLDGSVSEAKHCGDAKLADQAVAVPRELGILHRFKSPSSLVAADVIERVMAKRTAFEDRVKRKQAAEHEYRASRSFMQEQ